MNLSNLYPPTRADAFLGFAENKHGNIFAIRICKWCNDCAAVEKYAIEKGLSVTHGICVKHYQEQLEKLHLN